MPYAAEQQQRAHLAQPQGVSGQSHLCAHHQSGHVHLLRYVGCVWCKRVISLSFCHFLIVYNTIPLVIISLSSLSHLLITISILHSGSNNSGGDARRRHAHRELSSAHLGRQLHQHWQVPSAAHSNFFLAHILLFPLSYYNLAMDLAIIFFFSH